MRAATWAARDDADPFLAHVRSRPLVELSLNATAMTWTKAKDIVQALIDRGELERVTPSRPQAHRMLEDARRHLLSARAIASTDPQGAYALTYSAARRSLVAILEAQGLRATSKGGHIILYDAALGQFDPPLGRLIRPFNTTPTPGRTSARTEVGR